MVALKPGQPERSQGSRMQSKMGATAVTLMAVALLLVAHLPIHAQAQEGQPSTLEIMDSGPVIGEELVLGGSKPAAAASYDRAKELLRKKVQQPAAPVEVQDTTDEMPSSVPPVVQELELEDIAEEIAAFEQEEEEHGRKLQMAADEPEEAKDDSWTFTAPEPKANIPKKPVINKKAVPKVNVPPRRPPPKKPVTQKVVEAVETVGHEIGDAAAAAARGASRLADKMATGGASAATRSKLAETKAWVKKKVEDAKAHRERKQAPKDLARDVDEL